MKIQGQRGDSSIARLLQPPAFWRERERVMESMLALRINGVYLDMVQFPRAVELCGRSSCLKLVTNTPKVLVSQLHGVPWTFYAHENNAGVVIVIMS